MRPARRIGEAGTAGFVLVGVVMFVLALTILGLTLYGLSGYESQFMLRSLDHEQALYRAEGGQQLVLALVTEPSGSPLLPRLGAATAAVGSENVTYAHAWQVKAGGVDSTGVVDTTLVINVDVRARVGEAVMSASGQFIPTLRRSPYKMLLASPSFIHYSPYDTNGVTPRFVTVTLAGTAWQTVTQPTDSLWRTYVNWPGRLYPDVVPYPDVSGFIAAHLAGATPAGEQMPGPVTITMHAGGGSGSVEFFTTPLLDTLSASPEVYSYDFADLYSGATIDVWNTAIWLVPRGIFFGPNLTIKGHGSNPTLVIVTGRNERDARSWGQFQSVGAWFEAGFSTQGCQVFIVSDGSVIYTDHMGTLTSNELLVPQLNIYADGILLKGPNASGGQIAQLSHDPSMDATADNLYSRGLLPRVPGLSFNAFMLVPGSWREP